MISASKIHELAECLGEFSITWVAEDGALVRVPRCRCSSFHGSGETMNIVIPASGQVRTVKRCTIIEFNGEEVIL